MSVYKEGYSAKAIIELASVRIFNDAVDFGAPTKKNDAIWNAAAQLVKSYSSGKRHESRYATGRSVEQTVTLIDEWAVSDETKDLKTATENYIVSFVSCTTGACKGKDGYINIFKKN